MADAVEVAKRISIIPIGMMYTSALIRVQMTGMLAMFIALRNTGDPLLPEPDIPEVYQILNAYRVATDASPMLNIRHQRYDEG
ncbi:histidine phosphatase superfamily protein [Tanacetum coccineum]